MRWVKKQQIKVKFWIWGPRLVYILQHDMCPNFFLKNHSTLTCTPFVLVFKWVYENDLWCRFTVILIMYNELSSASDCWSSSVLSIFKLGRMSRKNTDVLSTVALGLHNEHQVLVGGCLECTDLCLICISNLFNLFIKC